MIELLARLVGPVLGHDPTVELQDLDFQHAKLHAEGRHAGAPPRQAPIGLIGDNPEQLLDAIAADP